MGSRGGCKIGASGERVRLGPMGRVVRLGPQGIMMGLGGSGIGWGSREGLSLGLQSGGGQARTPWEEFRLGLRGGWSGWGPWGGGLAGTPGKGAGWSGRGRG